MNKQEIDRRVQRLQRLVQQAEVSESEAAARLGVCLRAVSDAEAKLKSLVEYCAPEQASLAGQNPVLLSNDRRFAASLHRAKDAQAGVVNQYQGQTIAAEANWYRHKKKLDVLMRALAAIQALQRQEIARQGQNLADDLVSQSAVMRPNH